MSGIAPRLSRFLESHRVKYEPIHHRRDYTAKETAADTHTPFRDFAKTVFLQVDGRYAMAVLPASEMVSPRRAKRALHATEVALASEAEVAELCPDCEVGAAPPFGNLYDLPVYVSPSLAKEERITFNAGSHEDAVRMAYRDYAELVEPQVAAIASRD